MSRVTWPLGERKAEVGESMTWYWEAPLPVRKATVPTCTISFKAGAYSLALASVLGISAEPTVSAISDDLKTITVSNWPSGGAVGQFGAAHLFTDCDGSFPVRVVAYDDAAGTVTLADPLPRMPSLTAGVGAWLIPALWVGTLPAQPAPERNIKVKIRYSYERGGGIAQGSSTEVSTLHVVVTPLELAVTGEQLARHMAGLGLTAEGEQSYDAALEMGERRVIEGVRTALKGTGLYEDDITSPQSLKEALLLYAASWLHMVLDRDRADYLRTQGDEALKRALEAMPLDTNGDGKPEVTQAITGTGAGAPYTSSAGVDGLSAGIDYDATTRYPFPRRC